MGSEFTTKYKLKYLMHYEAYQYVQDAINREKEIKGWRREKKIDLIHENNPEMKDLAQELFDELGITHDEINEIVESIKNRYKL